MSQLSPSQALTVNEGYSFSQEDPIRLGIPVTRHEKRPSRLHTEFMRFDSDLLSSYLQSDINKFPSAHNRGHGFQKFKTLQGCPNLAHHKLSRSTKDIPSPRKTRSDSESRLQDISTMVKQDQQSRPNVPTNPDRSCTYLVLKAHRMRHPTSKTRPRVSRRGSRSLLSSDQHSKEHWPGGLK